MNTSAVVAPTWHSTPQKSRCASQARGAPSAFLMLLFLACPEDVLLDAQGLPAAAERREENRSPRLTLGLR